MPIKPVDFQVMLPKTLEVSKIHQDEVHKNQAIQQQQTAANQLKTEEHLQQVYSQDKAHEGKIREKQEKDQRDPDGKKKKKKGNYGTGKEIKEEEQASTIDIRL